MQVKSAEFLVSSAKLDQCPTADKPEYAFIGRSNVGKSSLINMLTNTKGLAKVSGTPGKTQLINHFLINKEWYLVDLPGYGYAKVSKGKRFQWNKTTKSYILGRENLLGVFVLVDSRHEPQKIDLEFMAWLAESGVPFVMVFTKGDKQSSSALNKQVLSYLKKMLNGDWEETPKYFVSSANTGLGKEDILTFVEEVNATWN